MNHYHVGHNMPGYLPESDVYCMDDVEDAVKALGEDIDNWAEFEFQLPESEQDDEASFASGLAEILKGGKSPEFRDVVASVLHGGASYLYGNSVYWVVAADGPREGCELNEDE